MGRFGMDSVDEIMGRDNLTLVHPVMDNFCIFHPIVDSTVICLDPSNVHPVVDSFVDNFVSTHGRSVPNRVDT